MVRDESKVQPLKDMGVESIRALGRPEHVLYDVKCCLPKDAVDGRL